MSAMLDEAEAALGPSHHARQQCRRLGDEAAAIFSMSRRKATTAASVNTRGTFFLTQAFARRLARAARPPAPQHRHHLLRQCHRRLDQPRRILRVEGGVSMVSKLFAARLANDGIGVYEIQPGFIETDMTAPSKAQLRQADRRRPHRHQALRHAGRSRPHRRDAGRAPPYTTGQIIQADAGLLTVRY